MLIGIDASRAVKKKPTGTETYAKEIILALARLKTKHQFILWSGARPVGQLAKLPKNFRWVIIPFPRFWSQIRLSWQLTTTSPKPDVLFEPAHTIPLVHPHPPNIVVTIHDLGFKYFPELYTPFERWYHNFSADFSIRHSAKIIAPSNYTKHDLLKNYPVAPEKIEVIYHGWDRKTFSRAKTKKTGAKLSFSLKLKQPYILFIGRIEAKKNVLNMLHAFRILKADPRINHQLVLAGSPGWGFDQIKQTLNDLPTKIEQDVLLTGYVSRKNYAQLLKGADVFLFTTLFEGFGLPVIEAMACGIPVVTSSLTSLPEIAGQAAMVVDPRSPIQIAKALGSVILSKTKRDQLVNAGYKRAQKFSWSKTASQTLAMLEQVGLK